MIKKSKVVLFFLLAFFAGSLTSSLNEWLQPISTIEIHNVSKHDISYVDITYQGAYSYKTRITENLKVNEVVAFKGITYGEVNYRLEIKFDDGTLIRGGDGYHDRGAVVREYVAKQAIMSSKRYLPNLFYSEPYNTTKRN